MRGCGGRRGFARSREGAREIGIPLRHCGSSGKDLFARSHGGTESGIPLDNQSSDALVSKSARFARQDIRRDQYSFGGTDKNLSVTPWLRAIPI
jgi:hypothetical protein